MTTQGVGLDDDPEDILEMTAQEAKEWLADLQMHNERHKALDAEEAEWQSYGLTYYKPNDEQGDVE